MVYELLLQLAEDGWSHEERRHRFEYRGWLCEGLKWKPFVYVRTRRALRLALILFPLNVFRLFPQFTGIPPYLPTMLKIYHQTILRTMTGGCTNICGGLKNMLILILILMHISQYRFKVFIYFTSFERVSIFTFIKFLRLFVIIYIYIFVICIYKLIYN